MLEPSEIELNFLTNNTLTFIFPTLLRRFQSGLKKYFWTRNLMSPKLRYDE